MSEQPQENNIRQEQTLTIKQQVEAVLSAQKVKHEVVSLPQKYINQLIILDQQTEEKEPTIRIYRGLNQIDKNLLEQVPFAMRTFKEKNGERQLEIMNDLKTEVDDLAQNPTYENLLNYVEKAKPRLEPQEIKSLEEKVRNVEECVLEGESVRNKINRMQILEGTAKATSGMTPFISFVPKAEYATGFGKAVMVVEVPLSMISDMNVEGHELNLKGALDPKYIKAFVPYEQNPKTEDFYQELATAMKILDQKIGVPKVSEQEAVALRKQKLAQEDEADKKQLPIDLKLVRLKRTERLKEEFPQIVIDIDKLQAENDDVYSKAKEEIFDALLVQLKSVIHEGNDPGSYLEEIAGKLGIKIIDKKNISEMFLAELMQRVGTEKRRMEDSEKQEKVLEQISGM